MLVIYLYTSSKPDKRYMVQINDKLIHFGSSQHSNFSIHRDEKRKQNYISRHKSNENWADIFSAGFWAKHLLWNKPTIRDSIKDIELRFKVNIINKTN